MLAVVEKFDDALPPPERKLVLMLPREGVEVGHGENRKVVNPEDVYKFAKLHGTFKEMADYFGVTTYTLKTHFQPEIDKGRAETKQAIRKAQIELALGGNAQMLMWLGKNLLSQSDSPEQEQSDKQGVTFEVKTIQAGDEKSPTQLD